MRVFVLIAAIAASAYAAGHDVTMEIGELCFSEYNDFLDNDGSDNICQAIREFKRCLDFAGIGEGTELMDVYTQDAADNDCQTVENDDMSDDAGSAGNVKFFATEEDLYTFRSRETPSMSIYDLVSSVKRLQMEVEMSVEDNGWDYNSKLRATEDMVMHTLNEAASAFGAMLEDENEGRNNIVSSLDEIRGSIAEAQANRDGFEEEVQSSIDAARRLIRNDLDNFHDDVTSQLDDMENSLLDSLSAVSGTLEELVDASAQRVQETQEAIEEHVAAAYERMEELADLAETQSPIIWSGGCRHHGHGGGWSTYCFNGNDRTDQFPQALYNEYIQPNGGEIRFRQEGYYRLNWWAIQHGCGSYNVQFESSWNGGHRNMAYAHRDSKPHGWFSNFMDQTWAFKEGDRFWMTVHGGWCNPYRWHSWNHNGDHSRMQVTYMGPLRS